MQKHDKCDEQDNNVHATCRIRRQLAEKKIQRDIKTELS